MKTRGGGAPPLLGGARRLAGVVWRDTRSRLRSSITGQPRCDRLTALERGLSLREVYALQVELEACFSSIGGKRFSRLAGPVEEDRANLAHFYAAAERYANGVRPFLGEARTILDYGGGVGTVASCLVTDERRAIVLDTSPRMRALGKVLSPNVHFFVDLPHLPPVPHFDLAFTIRVFFHLTLAKQGEVLRYVFARLHPGGLFLVHNATGPVTHAPRTVAFLGTVKREEFEEACVDVGFEVRPERFLKEHFVLRKPKP